MCRYILFYGDKKPEDNILITNMFENTKKINLCWTDLDVNNSFKIVEEQIKHGVEQIIFFGLEIGWDKLMIKTKDKYSNIKIKVVCNTLDSLLYYEYERNNFFKMLELSKKEVIDNIAFLKKGQYEVYKQLGYKCVYLMQNYRKNGDFELRNKNDNQINIGIYPLNYTWDKNIFNQLCIGKFVENSVINYNMLDERMKDFLDTMEIKNKEDNIKSISENEILEKISKNDIIISCSFTEYFHTMFFISMEMGVPCIIGNTSNLFNETEELKQYVVTDAEDNAIINSKLVTRCLENKQKIILLYRNWKEKYDKIADESKKMFLNI